MARTLVPVTELTPPKATLTTALTGTNNDLVFTARKGGPGGNSIQIEYIDPGGASATLAVTVKGFLISVSLGRAASAINSTAAQVLAEINKNSDAFALVTIANAASNDGSGLVTALSATALSGGLLSTLQPSLVNGDATNDHYITGNTGNDAGRIVVEVVSTDAGAQTVSIMLAPGAVGGVAAPAAISEPVAAGATRILGPFDPDLFNQNATGEVWFDPSVSNTLDFRAYRITVET